MLSIGKLTPGRASYYVEQLPAGADDYYLSNEHEGAARWLGAAAGRLGLDGDVTPEAFRRLLDACHPGSGEPLGVPHTSKHRVAGFDLCFSSPKSVSVLWALAPPDIAAAVADAHDRAVTATVAALEAEAVRARRGAGGLKWIETEGVVAAAFAHRSSRAGDPQLHTHVVVPNLTPDAAGRWTAPDGTLIYRWAKTLGFIYQAELRAGLSETLGVRWGPVSKGVAEIGGVPDGAIREFSTRRSQITAALQASGGRSRDAAQTATLATRAAKHTVADLATLRHEWIERAASLGVDMSMTAAVTGPGRPVRVDIEGQIPGLVGPAGLTANNSTFERRDVLQALASAHPDGARAEALRHGADQVLTHTDVIGLSTTGPTGPRYSTADLLAIEADLVRRAQQPTANPLLVDDATLHAVLDARPTLSPEQAVMVTALCRSDAPVQLVIGRAGTGKTYALDAARAGWASAGRPVIGAALAARAAAELQAGAGIPATTLDRLLSDLDRPGPLTGLPPHAVVVVDEAGMVGTRKLARLVTHTTRAEATLVLVGDHCQLPEIDAGGAFAALASAVPTVELTTNRRQTETWERDALDQLRAGPVPEALRAYNRHGRITMAATPDQAREKMVGDWWDDRIQGHTAAMYALRRGDVEDLNHRARGRLRAAGLLGDDELAVAGRSFAVGDEILCLRNDRRLGVRNGTTATVAAVHPESGELSLDTGVRLPAGYLTAGHVTHSYATTIHKAQGATVDRAFLLGSETLYREAGYVGLSRARQSNQIYLVSPAGDRGPNLLADLTNRLTRSQAQQLATDQMQLPDNTPPGRPGPDPHLQAVLADPAPSIVAILGDPPLTGFDRDRWAERAARLDAYRHIYQIDDPTDPLGPRPDDPAQRRAWELANLALLEHHRTLDLDQGLHL